METEIESKLRLFGVPTLSWGKGQSKTVSQLQIEIENSDSVLEEIEGSLFRSVSVLYLEVFCRFNDRIYRLREDRQEFKDGRIRIRDFISCSLAEKIKTTEQVDEKLVIRAIQEELGISRFLSLNWKGVKKEEKDSPSYPGLKARFCIYHASVFLCPDDFVPEGYSEEDLDKTTFFVWDLV